MAVFFNGDLITNGGFEAGFLGWTAINTGLTHINEAHEGMVAAAMGKADNTIVATLTQTTPIVASSFHKIYFYVGGRSGNPCDVILNIEWLGFGGNLLGPALPAPIVVTSETIGNAGEGEWKFMAATTTQAPLLATSARITFTKQPGDVDNYLVLDDVVFAAQ